MTTVRDSFGRTSASGWGSTDSGLPWSASGGLASERTVAPGAGRITLASSPGSIRANRLERPWADSSILAQFSVGQTAVGEGLLVGLMLRRSPSDSAAFYRVRAALGVDGSVALSVTRGITQVGTSAATALTYTPGARLWMRARVDGHQVRARIWAHGTAEPGTWGIDRTVTTDTIPVGDAGVLFSGFANNTNPSPYADFHRVEVTYPTLVENRLHGPVAAQVSTASLAATAEAGTVTIAAAGTRAVYSDEQVSYTLPTVRVQSGHHRAETPRLRAALPATGPWSARWYCWMPRLQDAGYGVNEVRSVAVLPSLAWTTHATAAGNVGTRLQAPDLAAAPVNWASEAGSAVATGRWWRCELQWNGSGTFTSQVFPGHSVTGGRIHTWTGLPDPGRTIDLTGYRWRRRTTLRWGDQGTEVAEMQNELIDLGYSLGSAGADGDFGNATRSAILAFQTARGLSPVDGEPGPETRAAMDLALGRIPPPLYLSHLAVADGQWIGPAEPQLPEDTNLPSRLRVGYLPI